MPGSVRSGYGGGSILQSVPSPIRTFEKGENMIEDLRADALAAAFHAFSIEVTLLLGGSITESKVILGIWTQPVTATDLGGFDVQSDRPSRILAVKRSAAPKITRGDRLRAEDGVGGPLRNFRVDGFSEIFSDHYRLTVVPDDTTTSGAPESGGKSVPDRKPPSTAKAY